MLTTDEAQIQRAKALFRQANEKGLNCSAAELMGKAIELAHIIALRGTVSVNPFDKDGEKELFYQFAKSVKI